MARSEETATFVEKTTTVPPDCHAVTDGETWEIHPKKLCKGAKIIRCSVCGEPATSIDPYFPYFAELNLCDRCRESKNRSAR